MHVIATVLKFNVGVFVFILSLFSYIYHVCHYNNTSESEYPLNGT
jgi:hypothetical protein